MDDISERHSYQEAPAQASAASHHTMSQAARRRIATLERSSPRLVQCASKAGVEIRYLGVGPLFSEPRAYAGKGTDWVIGPATDRKDCVIPTREREGLLRLERAGLGFPLLYVAHEIPTGRLALADCDISGSAGVALDPEAASLAVGEVPPPAGTTALASRLGRRSERLLTILGKSLPLAGAVAAAPFLLAAAAVGALTTGLDPIIFGVIPAGRPVCGQPAAWYILASWEWPPTAAAGQKSRLGN